MFSNPLLNTIQPQVSNILLSPMPMVQSSLCIEQSEDFRTTFLSIDATFTRLFKLGIIDEFGNVQEEKFRRNFPCLENKHAIYFQKFFEQRLVIPGKVFITLFQFLKLIEEEAKQLKAKKTEVFFYGKEAWKFLEKSGFLTHAARNLEGTEEKMNIQENLEMPFVSNKLEILVFINGTAMLTLLKNGIMYSLRAKEYLDFSQDAATSFKFSNTSFNRHTEVQFISLATENGSTINLRIINLDSTCQTIPYLPSMYSIQPFLDKDKGPLSIQFASDSPWQTLVNSLIGCPTNIFHGWTPQEKWMALVMELNSGIRPICSNLESIKLEFFISYDHSRPITQQIIDLISKAFEIEPPDNMGKVYAILFQICSALRLSDAECKSLWKTSEQFSSKFKLNECHMTDPGVLELTANLIIEHEISFTFILGLFEAIGYIHQHTDILNHKTSRPISFTLTGGGKEGFLQICFDEHTKKNGYALIGINPQKALSNITKISKQFSGNTQKIIITLYEMLLPLSPIESNDKHPAFQWLYKLSPHTESIVYNEINKMLEDRQTWFINHLAIMFLSLDVKSSFCQILEHLPGILSSPMTTISRKLLFRSLEQFRYKYNLSEISWEKTFEITVKNENKSSINYFRMILNYLSNCKNQKILLSLKKIWINEVSPNVFLNGEYDITGIQLLRSLIKASLTIEAITLYEILLKKSSLQYQEHLDLLSALCLMLEISPQCSKTNICITKLGECTKLILQNTDAEITNYELPKQIPWLISELIKLDHITLVNDILNHVEEYKLILNKREKLEIDLLRQECQTAMSVETIRIFLSHNNTKAIAEGDIWLKALQYAEHLKAKQKKALIHSWVKAELNNTILYKTHERRQCWEIALGLLKEIPKNNVISLYKKLDIVLDIFPESNIHICAILKETIWILFKQLPAKPDDDLLFSLISERAFFSLSNTTYFLEIDMPIIILLSHSDSFELKNKSLIIFSEWITKHYIADLFQPFANTLMQLFASISDCKETICDENVEFLQTSLINLAALLRMNKNQKLDYFCCAEQCAKLSLPEAKKESTALLLAGLTMHEPSSKNVKHNQVLNDKHLLSALYQLLECPSETYNPKFLLPVLKNENLFFLINIKSTHNVWDKFFTNIYKIIKNPDSSDKKKTKWYILLLVHLEKFDPSKELIQKHFICLIEIMFATLQEEDLDRFEKLYEMTSTKLIPNMAKNKIQEKGSERSRQLENIYLPLYSLLFTKCLKFLNETTDKDLVEILFKKCTAIMTVISLKFKFYPPNLDHPIQEFCNWTPSTKNFNVLCEYIPFLIAFCEDASENDLFKKYPKLAPEFIPAVFNQLFTFIKVHPEENELIPRFYKSTSSLIEVILAKKILPKQTISKLISQIIIYSPLPYSFNKEEDEPIQNLKKNYWIHKTLKASLQQNQMPLFEGESLYLYLNLNFSSSIGTYEQKKITIFGLFEKLSLYPSYFSAIRTVYLLSLHQDMLLPKDYEFCFKKLLEAICQLTSNLKTNILLANLCRTSCFFIKQGCNKEKYIHPHPLVFLLLKLQINTLNDQFNSFSELTPQLIMENAAEFVTELCREGVYQNRWSDLYAIMQFLREISIKRNLMTNGLFGLSFLNIMTKYTNKLLINPIEQKQRAEFFLLCTSDALQYSGSGSAVTYNLSVIMKETEIFLNCEELLEHGNLTSEGF